MRKLGIGILSISLIFCAFQTSAQAIKNKEVERIISTLASDEMQGRATFTPGIARAATFIENEFKKIGLQPLSTEKSFRQSFSLTRIMPKGSEAIIDGNKIDSEDLMVISDLPSATWNKNNASLEIIKVEPGQQFFNRYRQIMAMKKPVLVFVDEQYADAFARLRANIARGRIVQQPDTTTAAVFVLGSHEGAEYQISYTNGVKKSDLFNVAGMIPGKSKPNEMVVFSGHYDHLGITKPVEGDSIANGADDDASGVTAVISLAKHFKKQKNNERTLIFAAFTAEEIGGYGSRYFSSKLNPDDVMAMFNIEMIGKESKFGKNAAFITGYERSNFGEILQKNLEGTEFKFHPDPYPQQQLFYRSDNATLAALGVPAHTISTDQIDTDKLYHSVDDEVESLNIENIVATIKAIALSSRSIVSGTDTPTRIPKLEGRQ